MVHLESKFLISVVIGIMKIVYVQNLHHALTEETQHVCRRSCQSKSKPMVCFYTFEIEQYETFTKECYNCPNNITDCFRKGCIPADGTRRKIVTINRKLPGPSIEVCQDDIVIVQVLNKMESESTTIHWHGQKQKACPYMDGVPYITQCPIQPFNTFKYTFKASQAGTHFWHSHMGMQRVDGAFGSLIVRVPEDEDHHGKLYDFDLSSHVMVINDWGADVGEKLLLSHFYGGDDETIPISLLINGLGRQGELGNGNKNGHIPAARFRVDKGYRYRFRVINSGAMNCPVELTINNHKITIISSDGLDIKPIEATTLITYAGERYDFILNANQPKSLYWIKLKGLINCNEKHGSVYQVGVLEYNGACSNNYPEAAVDYSNTHNEGVEVNPLNKGTESTGLEIPVPRFKAINKWDKSLKPEPDFQYYLGFDFNVFSTVDEQHEGKSPQKLIVPQFNHISLTMPSVPLLTQRKKLGDTMFCNNETMQLKDCRNVHCQCLHGIKIRLGEVVELIFVDEGSLTEGSHPIHLHGHDFRIVAMERLGSRTKIEDVKKRDALGLIHRNLVDAPIKDTVTVPDGGYTIVRFAAENPGFWLLHCHIEIHMTLGMALILQVGEEEEMVAIPENFPNCGLYLPDVMTSISHIEKNSGGGIKSKLSHYDWLLVILIFF